MGRIREEKKKRRKKIRGEKESEEEDAGARKGRKVAKHRVFPMFCGSRRSKSRFAKAAGAEPFGEMKDERCVHMCTCICVYVHVNMYTYM